MITTQSVLALGALLILVAGSIFNWRGRAILAYWLYTAGFLVASLWSILGVFAPEALRGPMSSDSYIFFGAMAIAATVYFGHTAVHLRPPQ